jgi:acetyl-CoA synthetase (ADP-forming)
MEECASQNVKTAIVISAGFGEVDETGSQLEHELVRIARKSGIRFTGPNCNGVYSAPPKFAGLFGPLRPLPGEIALVTQGGSPGVVIHNLTHCRRRGLSRFVNVGDAADLDISDFIEYYGQDPSTNAIMCYFEGLKDGRKFMDTVKHASKRKPVIVMKGGTGETSQRVVASHVGALAGSDSVVSAALKTSGAIRTDSLSRMFDIAIAFSTQPLPRGNRVGILTFGGGVAVQFMDQADRLGLNVPPLDKESISALNKILPAYWSHGNPVDTTDGAVTENVVQICADTLMKLEYVDILVVIGIGTMEGFTWLTGIKDIAKMGTDREISVAKLLAELRDRYGKPVIGIKIHANEDSEVLKYLREDSRIPMYDEPQTAALALKAMLDYRERLNLFPK